MIKKKAVEKKKEIEILVVDEAYLEAHPEMKTEGVEVGDTIEVPTEAPVVKEKSKLNLDGEVSILRDKEYVRTYPKGSEEAVRGFLGKDVKYSAVPASSVAEVQVSFSVMDEKTGVMSLKMVSFTEEKDGDSFKEDAIMLKNEKRGVVIAVIE